MSLNFAFKTRYHIFLLLFFLCSIGSYIDLLKTCFQHHQQEYTEYKITKIFCFAKLTFFFFFSGEYIKFPCWLHFIGFACSCAKHSLVLQVHIELVIFIFTASISEHILARWLVPLLVLYSKRKAAFFRRIWKTMVYACFCFVARVLQERLSTGQISIQNSF